MSQSSFSHSAARVPRLYKEAGRIVQKVRLEGGSFKGLVYQSKHKCIKSLYALVAETLRHGSELDTLLQRTKLLLKEPRLDPWLARVLITELLWRQRALSGPAMPLKIVQSYKTQLLSEQAALSTNISRPGKRSTRPRFVRVNTLKTTVDAIKRNFTYMGWQEVFAKDTATHVDDNSKYSSFLEQVNSLAENEFIQDYHIPDLLVFPGSLKFYELEEYHNSSLILQDKASCLSAYFLDAPVGSTVLDMCAAPGMKTTHVAASLANKGLVYAIEKHNVRYESLCKIVEECGATCVQPIHGDALQFSHKELPDVEYIIVDPSCSGSGMCNREDLFNDSHDVSKDRLQKLSGFQCGLLRRAMTSFPSVKRIVYSTCSIFPEENEAVIETVLNTTPPNFVPVHLPKKATWLKQGSSSYQNGTFGLYTQPQVDLTNGFFIVLFERTGNEYVHSEKLIVSNLVSDTLTEVPKSNKKVKKKNKQKIVSTIDLSQRVPNDNKALKKLKNTMQALCESSHEMELHSVSAHQAHSVEPDDQIFPKICHESSDKSEEPTLKHLKKQMKKKRKNAADGEHLECSQERIETLEKKKKKHSVSDSEAVSPPVRNDPGTQGEEINLLLSDKKHRKKTKKCVP